MEVGAVKQAFNNEVIQLKRNLNQAKIQTIHKLTRKAKTFAEKKAPEKLKEKLKRKSESAVNEVLLMKKIKPKVIAKFAVTHKGNLQDYLNKPVVDQDKACARLLLHKSLQEKYNYIRNTFSNIPISDLLMSRQERRKMKKEALEKQKTKRDKKQKVINAEGEWKVENLKTDQNNDAKTLEKDAVSDDDEDRESDSEGDHEEENENSGDEEIEEQNSESDHEVETKIATDEESDNERDSAAEDGDNDKNVGQFVRPSPAKDKNKPKMKVNDTHNNTANPAKPLIKNKSKPEIKKTIKPRDPNKNKKLNEKLISRNFKKDLSTEHVSETKIVDPFFITSTGENYMSVAEPRQPDEVKEIHKQGNRKLRRAAMFGHEPKIKPRQDFREGNFNRQNDSQGRPGNKSNWSGDSNYNNNHSRNESQFKGRNDSNFKSRDYNQFKGRNDNQFRGGKDSQFKGKNDNQFKGRNDSFRGRNDAVEPKVEKLHPSWEAKKKKSGLLPFQGKKIVFDES